MCSAALACDARAVRVCVLDALHVRLCARPARMFPCDEERAYVFTLRARAGAEGGRRGLTAVRRRLVFGVTRAGAQEALPPSRCRQGINVLFTMPPKNSSSMVRAPPAGHTGYPTPPVHATREVVVEIGSELRRVDTPAPRASSPATMRQTAAHLAASRAPDEELPAEARAREEARDATAWGPPGEQKHGRRPRLARQEGEMARWRDGVFLLAGRPTRRRVSRFLACAGLGGQLFVWYSASR